MRYSLTLQMRKHLDFCQFHLQQEELSTVHIFRTLGPGKLVPKRRLRKRTVTQKSLQTSNYQLRRMLVGFKLSIMIFSLQGDRIKKYFSLSFKKWGGCCYWFQQVDINIVRQLSDIPYRPDCWKLAAAWSPSGR